MGFLIFPFTKIDNIFFIDQIGATKITPLFKQRLVTNLILSQTIWRLKNILRQLGCLFYRRVLLFIVLLFSRRQLDILIKGHVIVAIGRATSSLSHVDILRL